VNQQEMAAKTSLLAPAAREKRESTPELRLNDAAASLAIRSLRRVIFIVTTCV